MNISKRLLFRKRGVLDPAFIISILSDGAGAFTIPTNSGTYNYDVEVVGGATFTGNTGNFQVTGLTPDTAYDLRITGVFPQFFTNDSAVDRARITDIKNWGTGLFQSLNNSFSGCTGLTNITATDAPNLTNATTTARCFEFCTDLLTINTSNWDFSTITSCREMFKSCTSATSVGDLSTWDTSNMTDIKNLFFGCNNLENPAIHNWDTSNVMQVGAMLRGVLNFNRSLAAWDIGNIVDLSGFMTFGGGNFSVANYDATLISWKNQDPNTGLSPDFGSAKFTKSPSDAEASRTILTNALPTPSGYAWTITDGGATS